MMNHLNQARTAADVADLETEVHLLREADTSNKQRIAILESENATLKIENAKLAQRAREEMTRATEIETIMNMTSSGLVAALQRASRNRQIAREARRVAQETELGVGGNDLPEILARPAQPAPPARDEHEREEARSEQLRGAAERIADKPPAFLSRPRMGTVDRSIAEHDPRIPRLDYPEKHEPALDQEQLRALGGEVRRQG